jgi:predicted RNA binding protein YcfA (HicA-like mRNA interferase family)
MKRNKKIKELRKAGYTITNGGKHKLAEHPDRPGKISIPHGNEINEYTANGILRAAGLK